LRLCLGQDKNRRYLRSRLHIKRFLYYNNFMKKLARLILVTFGMFFLLFVLAVIFSYLKLWITAAAAVPVQIMLPIDTALRNARWAVSMTLYTTTLFSMNYAQRNSIFAPLAFICVILICGGMSFAVIRGFENTGKTQAAPLAVTNRTLGSAGLMLTQRETVTVLTDRPSLETGSRVVAAQGRPLVYQDVPLDENGALIPLPPVRFPEENTLFYTGLWMDLDSSAVYLFERFDEGLVPFAVWLFSLLLLLTSLSYIFNIGAWPLASLFLCAVLFRLVLLFETFISSDKIQAIIMDFSRSIVPQIYILPIIIALPAVLALIYDVLMFFARERGRNGSV
jgi:hypothetical protein